MHGLTTIAALPRTGGAGMALRGETNTRPIARAVPLTISLLTQEGGPPQWYINLCKLREAAYRETEAWMREHPVWRL